MKKSPKIQKRIYLDYASITPIDKRVEKAMDKAKIYAWGNPSSLHKEGIEAKEILEKSREEAAKILNARSGEVYFTSSGTEGANIAILGVLRDAKERGIEPHIIVSSIEHPAILEPIKYFANKEKCEVTFINPDENGIINPKSVELEIKENTVLVCISSSNSEIGTIQSTGRIGSIIKEYRKKKPLDRREPLLAYPYFLVDASGSTLYENVSIERFAADILVLDGMKMYGPRGSGMLLIKHGAAVSPVFFGGGQERNLRPGTENVLAAVGISTALQIAQKEREREVKRLIKLRDYAIDKILKEIPNTSLNGDRERRLSNNINICFENIDSEFFVIKLDTLGFSASSASACMNNKNENSSYVLEAIGKSECASSSLRFTLGRETKKSDLDKLIKTLKVIV